RQAVTLIPAPQPLPQHAAVSTLPSLSPCRRPSAMTSPCPSILPVPPCSCSNSPRFGFLFVELRFCPTTGLATGTIGPHRPSPRSVLPATQSFAGSAHSVHSPGPPLP